MIQILCKDCYLKAMDSASREKRTRILKKSYVRNAGLLTPGHAFAATRLSLISLMKCVRSVPVIKNKLEIFINQSEITFKPKKTAEHH